MTASGFRRPRPAGQLSLSRYPSPVDLDHRPGVDVQWSKLVAKGCLRFLPLTCAKFEFFCCPCPELDVIPSRAGKPERGGRGQIERTLTWFGRFSGEYPWSGTAPTAGSGSAVALAGRLDAEQPVLVPHLDGPRCPVTVSPCFAAEAISSAVRPSGKRRSISRIFASRPSASRAAASSRRRGSCLDSR